MTDCSQNDTGTTERCTESQSKKKTNFKFKNGLQILSPQDIISSITGVKDILQRSLKANKIDPDDTERVNKFCFKLVKWFARTMRAMLVEENYILKLPVSIKGYLFVAVSGKNIAGHYPVKMYIRWVVSKSRLKSRRVPEYVISFATPINEYFIIRNCLRNGRVFLDYSDFVQYIESELPYNRKIREAKPIKETPKPKPKPKKRKKKPKVYKMKTIKRLRWNEDKGRYEKYYVSVRARRKRQINNDDD